MSTLTDFRQSSLLRLHATDPITRQGVCVALCDYWLSTIKADHHQSAEERLDRLGDVFPQIMSHQIRYANLRAQHGRNNARRTVGRDVGLQYDTDKTIVTRRLVGLQGIRDRITRDLACPGVGATWSMRFATGGGHAIAGFYSARQTYKQIQLVIHLFDPNIGEYIGHTGELDDMLRHLMTRFSMYAGVTSLHRATEG